MSTLKRFTLLFIAPLVVGTSVYASGLDRNGVGARSMGMGGATLADFDDAMTSAGSNPAALGFMDQADLYLTVAEAWASGSYKNRLGETGSLDETWNTVPEFAVRLPLNEDLALAVSLIPDSSQAADWTFRDPEGGIDGDTSYGYRHHESKIINVRAALGLGWKVAENLSLGASIGTVYTRNELHSPYIFQSHPALKGMKTLLDLETEGYGVNGDLAVAWKAMEKLTFALSYRTPTEFKTEGTAKGDIGAQFRSLGLNGVPTDFEYDADIKTKLPQKLALGTSWKALPRLRLNGQVEWVNWSQAYDSLKVNLSNSTINGVLGSDEIKDEIPLNWEDRFVYRTGLEFDVTDSVAVRAGYSYAKSPVPNTTLLPMTAAIFEHTLAAGIGYQSGPFRLDLSYQHDLESSQRAASNGIAGTEYDNSEISVKAHWVGLTVGFDF